MHLELPSTALKSFKDFLKHYLMIVLSILTALGLEAWIERVHHQHAAEAASEQIDAEIRTNLVEVREALAKDTRQADVLGRLRDTLEQDLKTKAPDKDLEQLALTQIHSFNFNLNLRWPTLRQEAWDVAVANQSASWIDSKRMYRYSAVYAAQRETATTLESNLRLIINGPRMIDTMTDLRSGSLDPHELLRVVAQMDDMQEQAKSDLSDLAQQMQNALDGKDSAAQ
ncbi:hypothetical protein EKH79_10855 [Dyella dinghuensis]|uniref:Uncharacterized protein n=1 Tax=Dyella dinghuensis TaxID=1920169 RepID=A0A3S0PCU2_9GAMM|nr:hypothetical protein [Dyella dinghuensis]RUL64520.1 hypothetical protein EKH79_10855 [Dyella dinghuensis]